MDFVKNQLSKHRQRNAQIDPSYQVNASCEALVSSQNGSILENSFSSPLWVHGDEDHILSSLLNYY